MPTSPPLLSVCGVGDDSGVEDAPTLFALRVIHAPCGRYGLPGNCSGTDCWARSNDYMGWHLQSQTLDLTGAAVKIEVQRSGSPWESPGAQRRTLVAPAVAVAGVGAGNTIIFGPAVVDGVGPVWRATAGATYRVTVTLANAHTIQYQFGVVDCHTAKQL